MKRDLQSLIPLVKEELSKGRKRKEVYEELFFDEGQRSNMNYYLRRDKFEEDIEEIIIIPPKVREKKYVTVNGVRYQDITEYIIDCGG